VFVGISCGVTALATKSRILLDLKMLDTRIAHVMLAGALISDTLSLVVFAGLINFHQTAAVDIGSIALVVGKCVAFFVVMGALGLYFFPWAARQLQRLGIHQRGIYFMLLLLIALLYAEAAELAGLHGILGTFYAGLFLQHGMLEPKLQRELDGLIRDVSVAFLAPIFFVTSGMDVSFDVFRTDLWLVISIMVVAFVGKIAGTALFYLPSRHGWREGVVIGAGMNGRGAVEIILAGIGLKLGLIDEKLFSILVFMAIVTTASVPLFLKWGRDWLQRRGELARSADKRSATVIVGASATARALAQLLGASQRVVLVDSNAGRVALCRAQGLEVVAGNALENEVLSQARAFEAGTLIALTTNAEINALAAKHAKETFLVPHLHVVATAGRPGDVEAMKHLGASTLFNQAVRLGDWDQWFDRKEAEVLREPVGDRTVDAIVAARSPEGPVLALAVERMAKDGRKVIAWHSDLAVAPGDVLVLARVRARSEVRTDRFDELVRNCPILDIHEPVTMDAFFRETARALAPVVALDADRVHALLMEREQLGSTVITPGLAVPHIILPGSKRFAVLVARGTPGVVFDDGPEPVHALFVLAGTPDERNFHLKALSAVAQIWQGPDFESRWKGAKDAEDLRLILLNAPRQRTAEAAR
jgi:Kef-type K+ transport system membrane component KefB/mannitol/fructose-specific phosphotransferase system IIA component (Ntr-type)